MIATSVVIRQLVVTINSAFTLIIKTLFYFCSMFAVNQAVNMSGHDWGGLWLCCVHTTIAHLRFTATSCHFSGLARRPQGFLSRLQNGKTIILFGSFSYFFSFPRCRTRRIAKRCALFEPNDEVIRFPAFTQLRYFLGIWHPTGGAASRRRYIFIWLHRCVLSLHDMCTRTRYSSRSICLSVRSPLLSFFLAPFF